MDRTQGVGPAALPRRTLLIGLLLAPPMLAGCSLGGLGFGLGADEAEPPDPLIVLAAAARSDAEMITAALAATPALTERLKPLLDARTAHAQALDAEVARLDPSRATARGDVPSPAPTTAPTARPPDLATVRQAVLGSALSAATIAIDLPDGRIGLVAAVAACCSAYAEVLR